MISEEEELPQGAAALSALLNRARELYPRLPYRTTNDQFNAVVSLAMAEAFAMIASTLEAYVNKPPSLQEAIQQHDVQELMRRAKQEAKASANTARRLS